MHSTLRNWTPSLRTRLWHPRITHHLSPAVTAYQLIRSSSMKTNPALSSINRLRLSITTHRSTWQLLFLLICSTIRVLSQFRLMISCLNTPTFSPHQISYNNARAAYRSKWRIHPVMYRIGTLWYLVRVSYVMAVTIGMLSGHDGNTSSTASNITQPNRCSMRSSQRILWIVSVRPSSVSRWKHYFRVSTAMRLEYHSMNCSQR